MGDTVFGKIVRKEIPAEILHESDRVMAFKDVNPQAPTHVLIIPKEEIPKASDIDGKKHAELLGEMFDVANAVAKERGVDESGYRLVFNVGPQGGQEVYHLHMHLLGGRQMRWPPG
ncbi:MAG: HIT domain-containing protein [Ignavibacteriales bacterium]|nr:HIT domain-containing protein [Ignavibacteriales bacterium]